MDASGSFTKLRPFFPLAYLRTGNKEDAWREKTNGQNNFWRIWVWSGIEVRAAVMAQELFEWGWRWKWGGSAALAVTALLGVAFYQIAPILSLFAGLPGALALRLVPEIKALQRQKELMSHEIEVQAASVLYGVDPNSYRIVEVSAMVAAVERGSYPWLRGISKADITFEMIQRASDARAWVYKKRAFLERVRDA